VLAKHAIHWYLSNGVGEIPTPVVVPLPVCLFNDNSTDSATDAQMIPGTQNASTKRLMASCRGNTRRGTMRRRFPNLGRDNDVTGQNVGPDNV